MRKTVVGASVLGALAGAGVAGTAGLAHYYEGKVGRDDVLGEAATLPPITKAPEWFVTNTPDRKSRSGTGDGTGGGPGENVLILGVDTRQGWTQGQSRSDTIMLVHINAAHTRAAVVSFPRDSYVYIPPVPGKWAGGRTKINAAYAWGGAPLVVQVLNHLTGVTVDHVVRADFAAVRSLTDIVGGVDISVRRTVTDKRTGYTFPAGINHLDGHLAEIYVRQRYGLPNGDFDRVKRQQQFLHALASKITSMGVLTDPLRLNQLIAAGAGALVVDKSLDLTATVRRLAGLRPDDLDFTTIPSNGYVHTATGTANRLSRARCLALFAALRSDTMAGYFARTKPFGASTGA
jgi:LCP family protein required for cell wall assembly